MTGANFRRSGEERRSKENCTHVPLERESSLSLSELNDRVTWYTVARNYDRQLRETEARFRDTHRVVLARRTRSFVS